MHKIKHCIAVVVKFPYRKIKTLLARKQLKSVRPRLDDSEVNVGFLVFETQTWDKLETLYDAMQNDKKFNTKIIIVPSSNNNFKYDIGKIVIENDIITKMDFHG